MQVSLPDLQMTDMRSTGSSPGLVSALHSVPGLQVYATDMAYGLAAELSLVYAAAYSCAVDRATTSSSSS